MKQITLGELDKAIQELRGKVRDLELEVLERRVRREAINNAVLVPVKGHSPYAPATNGDQ